MKGYFKKNKIKTSITAIVGLCLILALAVFAVYKFPTLAGLFQKDKDGKIIEKNIVTVLEIVAQDGQQIIGYTVSGQEPITKEKIEQYHGDIDVEDFKNATGYVLKKEASPAGYNYTVEDDVLADTFNQNVLGGNMTDEGDQIIVKVVQAKDLVASDLDDADLVYLNSADSNANLLYYYDQIMNEGKGNIAAGTYGATYNDTFSSKENKQVYALKLFAAAAGKPAKASLLTEQVYKWAGLKGYSEIYLKEYNNAVGELAVGIYNKSSNADIIKSLEKLMADTKTTANAMAVDNIKTFSQRGDISEEERNDLERYLLMYEEGNVYKVNMDSYIQSIITQKVTSKRSINSVLSMCNTDNLNEAVTILKECKASEEKDINRVADVIGKVLSSDYDELNAFAYAQNFLSDEFEIDETLDNKTYAVKVGETFKNVNAVEKEVALNLIAQAPTSDDAMVNLSADAVRAFKLSEIEGYDEVLLDKYLAGISELDDKKEFLIQKEVDVETKETSEEETTEGETTEEETTEEETTEEETTEEETTAGSVFVWTYNETAIKNFIERINTENSQVDVNEKYDMSWDAAMALYDYAMVQERGFMYSTAILEKHRIGDYTTSDPSVLASEGVDNTNNVYKMLLVLRQLNSDYFVSTVRPKIDSEGYYFTEGLNEKGEGITSDTDKGNNAWYKGTFLGSDSTDATKYREPDVIGDTYVVVDGGGTVKGPNKNYVNKKTYSFSGEQFLGGEAFVNGVYIKQGVVILEDSQYVQDSYNMWDNNRLIVVNNKDVSGVFKNVYACFWNSEKYNIKMAKCDSNYPDCYYGYESKGSKSLLFMKDTNFSKQTIDYNNVNYTNGNMFAIESWTNSAGKFNLKSKGKVNGDFGFYAEPGAKDSDNTITFTDKVVVDLHVRGNTGTKYEVYVNGSKTRDGDFSEGSQITLGNGDGIGTTYQIILYDAFGVSKTYNYKKIDMVVVGDNYRSENTASNDAKLQKDDSQPASYNNLISGVGTTKGDIIEYIMGIEENVVSLPYKILVIEPIGGVTELDDYESAQYLAKSLKFDYTDMNKDNYKNYFNVTCMGVREFNTRKDDLTAKYDLIYFGINSGAMSKYEYKSSNGKTVKRTYFRDKSMDGLVYTGIGDIIPIRSGFRGTAADDYTSTGLGNATFNKEMEIWRKFFFAEFKDNADANWNLSTDSSVGYVLKNTQADTRLCGNDITVSKMNELLDYLKAGYPIMFAEGLLNSDEYVVPENSGIDSGAEYKSIGYDKAVKLRYLDKYSKLYNFIEQAKKLGYDEASGTYTGIDVNGNRVFNDGRRCASLIKYEYAKSGKNPDYLDSAHKFDGGLAYAARRNLQVDFNYVSGPQQYHFQKGKTVEVSAGTIGNDIDDTSSYAITLELTTNVPMKYVEDNFEIQMYVDKSGIGSFEERASIELDPSYIFNEKTNTVNIMGKWPGDLEGFIPWKIEVFNKNNPDNKWTYIGYSAFPCAEKKDVNVLWVKTNGNHLEFKNKLDAAAGDIKDYNIHTYTVSYSDFVKKWEKEDIYKVYDENSSLLKVGTFDSNSTDKEKAFDMVVFGYCDSYSGLDINNIACLNNIDYYVNVAKHSLLFAHDNAGWRTSYNYYTNTNAGSGLDESGQQFARYTTSYMRGMLGMDYYGASFSPLAFNPASTTTSEKVLKDLYVYNQGVSDARKYLNPNLDQSDFRGYQDGHLLRYIPNGTGDAFWPYRSNNGTGSSIGTSNKGLETTTKVKRTNQGQITMYPYNIGENLNVSTTHFQYTRLNMEDDDVTVWYTLDGSAGKFYNIMGGDGSNNFYIYSKGNITYTGAGHSTVNQDVEIKLFINTVVAAIKVGTTKPTVSYTNASSSAKGNHNVMYAYDTDDSFEVKFKPTDYDNKKGTNCFTDCKVFIDMDGDGAYDPAKDILINGDASILKSTEDGSPLPLNGSDLVNRQEMAYKIMYTDLAQIGMNRGEIGWVDLNDKNKVYEAAMEFLSKHDIYTVVTTSNINQYGEIEQKESDPSGFTVAKKKFNYLN